VEFENSLDGPAIVPEFYGGATTLAGATAVPVTAGVTSTDIDIQLARPTGSLAGTVTDGTARPLSGVQVTAYGLDGRAVGSGALSAADGSYTVAGLSPGFYRVGFALSGYTGQFYPNDAAAGQSIYVAAAQTASGIDAQLQAPDSGGQQQQQPQQQSSPPSQPTEQPPAAGSSDGSDAPVAVAATVGAAGVTGATVSANVSCAGPATNSCTITLTLTTVETSKGSTLLELSAAKKARTTRRTVTVGALTVRLAGGQSKTAHVKLNAVGRRLLGTIHKLPVELVCVTGATRISTQTLTLKPASKQPKKH
jgi:hypothetical protein